MKTVMLPSSSYRQVLSMLGELAQIQMPREGKRDVRNMGQYIKDAEIARKHTMALLGALAGYKAEADDAAEARATLHQETREAFAEALAWMTKRKEEDWQ